VLAALDAAAPARETLQAAAALAARLHADLEALLFAAPELRRVMGLASTRHVALPGGAALAPEAVTRGLEAAILRMREEVERAATRARLRWSLRVLEREADAGAALAAAESLLVLDRASWASRAAALEEELAPSAGRRVLVLGAPGRAPPAAPRVWAVWDASEPARAALDLARQVSAGTGQPARLLVAAGDLREAERRAAQARGASGPEELPWRWAGGGTLGDLVRALPTDAFLVVATGSPAVGGRAGRERLLRAAGGPVLLLG
jgi:hypothetical protein